MTFMDRTTTILLTGYQLHNQDFIPANVVLLRISKITLDPLQPPPPPPGGSAPWCKTQSMNVIYTFIIYKVNTSHSAISNSRTFNK
jgi:hypothetical protein